MLLSANREYDPIHNFQEYLVSMWTLPADLAHL